MRYSTASAPGRYESVARRGAGLIEARPGVSATTKPLRRNAESTATRTSTGADESSASVASWSFPSSVTARDPLFAPARIDRRRRLVGRMGQLGDGRGRRIDVGREQTDDAPATRA